MISSTVYLLAEWQELLTWDAELWSRACLRGYVMNRALGEMTPALALCTLLNCQL